MKFSEIPQHLFFHNNNLITSGGTQYRIGTGSKSANENINRMIEIANLRWNVTKLNHKLLLDVKAGIEAQNPVYTPPEYRTPNTEFISLLAKFDNRLNLAYVSLECKTKPKTTNQASIMKGLRINFTKVAILHFNKFGYWADIEEIKKALKEYRTEEDAMDWMIKGSLKPNAAKGLKDAISFDEDIVTTETIVIETLPEIFVPDLEYFKI